MRCSVWAVAMLLIWAAGVRAGEAEAVMAIEKLGGTITRDDNQPGRPVVTVNLLSTKVTDPDLKELKELKELRSLDLGNTKVTDAGLKELQELKRLTTLGLMQTQVTDAGVKELQAALPKCKIDRPNGARKVPKGILQKRVDAARRVYELNKARIRNNQGLPAELFGWSERWLDAELALCEKESERVKAFRDHLDRTREVERLATAFARSGQGRQADADAATYFRLEAEIRLYKEGIEPHPAKEQK